MDTNLNPTHIIITSACRIYLTKTGVVNLDMLRMSDSYNHLHACQ